MLAGVRKRNIKKILNYYKYIIFILLKINCVKLYQNYIGYRIRIISMEQNIFQVVKEDHFDEILNTQMQNLILVMLSSKTCKPCKTFKPKFVDLSKKNKDTVFIYIDRDNYELTQNKYFLQFKFTPTFVFYFGKNQIAFIEGAHEEALVKTISLLKQKIEEKKREFFEKEKMIEEQKIKELQNTQIPLVQQPVQPVQSVVQQQPRQAVSTQNSELLAKKMELLNKFKLLAQNGISVPKYNLDSDYNEMLQEFKNITETLNLQLSQHSNESENSSKNNEEMRKKQEQIRQIQELDKLNQKLQPQTLQKLQHLKKILQMKEQQEKNNRNV